MTMKTGIHQPVTLAESLLPLSVLLRERKARVSKWSYTISNFNDWFLVE